MIPFSRLSSEWRCLRGTCHEVGHTWSRSCVAANLELTGIVFYEGMKLYLPLYVLSTVLRGKLRHPRDLIEMVLQTARSAAFLTTNVNVTIMFLCLLRKWIGCFYLYSSVLVPSFIGSLCAIFVERKSRRPLLAGYVATLAVDVFYNMLKHRKLVSPLPHGEVLIFSLASAVLFHKYKSGSGLKDLTNIIIGGLLSPWLPSTVRNSLKPTALNTRPMHILLVGLWSFGVGYLIQSLLSLLGQGTQILKDKSKILKAFGARSIRFGAFLSSLAAGFKFINSVIYYLPVSRDVRLLLAGLASGLSMLLCPSSSLSLYMAWRALEALYSSGVDKGWLRYIPHGYSIIYALGTALLFHALFFEAHNLRPTYWHFARRSSWERILQFDYDELDKFGTGSSKVLRKWREKERRDREQHSQPSSDVGGHIPPGSPVPQHHHHHHPNGDDT